MGNRRLLLVNPIQWLGGRRQRGWNGNRFVPPLSLAYVAALTPDDWEIRIVDENAGQDATQLAGFAPDLVGITAYTATIPRAYQLAAHFRGQGVPVVIGGSHASALPEEVTSYADVAFIGQAEGAWPQVLDDFQRGRLQAVYDGGSPDLKGLVLPRRDLYPRHYLFDAVMTAKGCPYRCEFCSVWRTYGRRSQLRPVDEVVDEVAGMRSRQFFIVDDNLCVHRQRAIDLCRGMVERGLKGRFAIQSSLEVGQDEELLGWLARAGCFLVLVGLESVDEGTLGRMRKASNLKVGVGRFAQAIARVHAHGMAVVASIILGNDDDTADTFRELESFVAESGIDSLVYTVLTPLPGTDLWDRLEAEGRLRLGDLPEDYARLDCHHIAYQPVGVSPGELRAAYERMVRRATSPAALARGLWRTWRRTGNPFASLAAVQNNRWAALNLGS
jgi:radical SAM superfamily enzyme YgiQ (UPF0313 family)